MTGSPEGEPAADGYAAVRKSSLGGRLKFLAKDSIVYGIASAVTRMFGLVTVPVLTRSLSKSEFGASDTLAVFNSLLFGLATFGQDAAVARLLGDTDDPARRGEILSFALVLELLACSAVCLGLIGFGTPIMRWSIGDASYASAFQLVLAGLPFLVFVSFARNLFKWTFARRNFILTSLGPVALNVTLTVVCVLSGLGVVGIYLSQLASNVVFTVVSFFMLRRQLRWPRRAAAEHGREMLKIGLPYMGLAAGLSLVPAVDRLLVAKYAGLADVGVYAIGNKLALLLWLPITAFQTAWGPFSVAIYRESDATTTYNVVLRYYVGLICILLMGLVAVAEPLAQVLASRRYLSGSEVVMPLAFGILLESVAWVTGIGIDLSKRTYLALTSYAAGLAASALFVWLLVRPFGIVGAASGVLIGQLVKSACHTAFAYGAYPIRLALRPPAATIVVAFLGCLAMELARRLPLAYAAGVRTIVFGCFVAGVWRLLLTEAERGRIVALVTSRLRSRAG